MDTWEYFTTTFRTDSPAMEVPVSDQVPHLAEYPKFSVYKLIPQMNELGRKGWKLLSIEPVQEGKNGDLRYADAASGAWTYTYFAVFKRRIPSE